MLVLYISATKSSPPENEVPLQLGHNTVECCKAVNLQSFHITLNYIDTVECYNVIQHKVSHVNIIAIVISTA